MASGPSAVDGPRGRRSDRPALISAAYVVSHAVIQPCPAIGAIPMAPIAVITPETARFSAVTSEAVAS